LPTAKNWDGAILTIHGNIDVNGTINVTFEEESVLDNEDVWTISSLGGGVSSKIINYDVRIESPAQTEMKTELVKTRFGWNETIQLNNVACGKVIQYHDTFLTKPCEICLAAGAGCSWCDGECVR